MYNNFGEIQCGDTLFFYNKDERQFYASLVTDIRPAAIFGIKIYTEHHTFVATDLVNSTIMQDQRGHNIVVFMSLNKASDYLNGEKDYHIEKIKETESIIRNIESMET